MTKRCVRCRCTEAEHPDNVTSAEALLIPDGQPCHRFEPKAPLWMRVMNR